MPDYSHRLISILHPSGKMLHKNKYTHKYEQAIEKQGQLVIITSIWTSHISLTPFTQPMLN